MAAANTLPYPETHTHPNPAPEQTTSTETASWHATVLGLLAQGASVTAAMHHVGYSVSAFHKTCERHPEFRLAANRARNTYRAKVAEDFHESEAYARMLVDAVQRDEQLPAGLRLRAALALLNRKPDRWLPSPILTPDDPVDTMDTFNALAGLAYRQLLAEFPDAEDLPQPDKPAPAGHSTRGLSARDTIETVDTMDTTDKVDTIDTADKASIKNPGGYRGIAESADPMGIRDTLDCTLRLRHGILKNQGQLDSATIGARRCCPACSNSYGAW